MYTSPDKTHWLVESGIGRVNASAAVMCLYYASGARAHGSWLNIGIAAHQDIAIGDARVVHQIVDASTKRTGYPIQVFDVPTATECLTTVDRVQQHPEPGTLYDMEGAAFFDVASRLSSAERTMLIKIISDHGMTPGTYPTREAVSRLVEGQMELIETVATELLNLSEEEARRLAPPHGFDALIGSFRFSVSLQHQLRDLLRRYQLLNPGPRVDEIVHGAQNGREVIRRLKDALDGHLVNWEQR